MIRTTVFLAVLATPLAARSTFEGALSLQVSSDKGRDAVITYLHETDDDGSSLDACVSTELGALRMPMGWRTNVAAQRAGLGQWARLQRVPAQSAER